MSLGLVMLLAVAIVSFVVLLRSVVRVGASEVVIVERLGRFNRILQPGTHLLVPVVDHARGRLGTSELAIAIGDEPVVAADDLVLRADARVTVVVEDPVRATYEVADLGVAIRTATRDRLREGVGAVGSNEAITRGASIIADLRTSLAPALREWGLRLVSVDGAISRRPG